MMLHKLFPVILLTLLLSPASALDPTQQSEMVTAHNKWRVQVGAPDLKWSDDLATGAQTWADHLKTAEGCNLVHSTSNVGENLYWASASTSDNGDSTAQMVTPTQVTDSWGGEKQDYSYDSNSCADGKVCGHYTQLVWKKTSDVGCGSAVCSDKSQVWVCQYNPAGNMAGEKPY